MRGRTNGFAHARRPNVAVIAVLLAVLAGLVLSVAPAQAAPVNTRQTPSALLNSLAVPASSSNPYSGLEFWSGIMSEMVIISNHAGDQMCARGVSRPTLENVMNEGRVQSRSGGYTYIVQGTYRVVTATRSGIIVTVENSGGGDFGGGFAVGILTICGGGDFGGGF